MGGDEREPAAEGSQREGIDLSPLHREFDRLKTRLCRCQHEGTCIACKGFEVLREQSVMVVSAASQPVLMQVAQEAAAKDLMSRLGNVQETLQSKFTEDAELQGLMGRMLERIQDDLGGPEALEELFKSFGMVMPNSEGHRPGGVPYDDRPPGPAAPPRDEDPTDNG